MIPDEEQAQPTSPMDKRKKSRKRRRNGQFRRTYLPFLAFLGLASLAYFHIDKQSVLVLVDVESKPPSVAKVNTNHATAPTSIPTTLQATSEITTDTDVDKKKHNLVLHIGPQKTGSTTLQAAWEEPFGILNNSLKQDKYLYRFIHPDRGYFNCDVSSYGGYVDCEASSKLKGVIRAAKNQGRNLLLSDENLDERFPQALKDVIDEDYWDVTVIVVYRRIHNWLHSWYDQINKTTNKDANGNILIDENGHPYRREHTQWPDEGGVPIPNFSTWYTEFTKHWEPSDLVSKHRSIAFLNAYKPFFDNIIVYDMHQEGDLLTNFMCDSLPDAEHSCQLLKRRDMKLPRDNQSVDLDYDILAVKAREEGILRTTFKRKYIGSRIERFVKENNKNLPRICDTEMMDEIKTWLLESQKEMFPERWSDQQEIIVTQSFDDYRNSGILCDIDFDKVFSDEEWLGFFESLDNRPQLVLHIGPQKTGSTTLQYAWNAPKLLKNVMRKEDDFDFYFINPYRGFFDCDMIGDRWDNCKASDKMKEILSTASEERRNLLLSDENLDDRFADALRAVIDDNQFRVRVVVVYRRIHQWLPSWYSQINKTANKDSNGKLLRNHDGQPERQPHNFWPRDGGVHIPSFTDWYKQFVSAYHSSALAVNHPSLSFKRAYDHLFDDIQVFDMGQEGDFVTNFMCQMIPEASTTCQRLTDGEIDLPLSNPSVNVEHDILSVQAYERGLIEAKLSRPQVVEEVRAHISDSGITLPRKCDDDVTKQIHDWLFESEMLMFHTDWTSDLTKALDTSFDKDYNKGKLCDIDIESVLEDKAWIDFFASLS